MNRLIYRALSLILKLNDRLYGVSASREVLRDLAGDWRPQISYREVA